MKIIVLKYNVELADFEISMRGVWVPESTFFRVLPVRHLAESGIMQMSCTIHVEVCILCYSPNVHKIYHLGNKTIIIQTCNVLCYS